VGVVGKIRIQIPQDAVTVGLFPYGKGDLHAPEEIPLHPVGAGEEQVASTLGVSTEKVEDPRMLEKSSDDGAHPDVVGDTGYAGTKRAQPADDEVDLHAGPRRLVQRFDDPRVHQ
jgi:hypothetical protein